VLGAVFILTAKLIEIVHDTLPKSKILDSPNVTIKGKRLPDFRKCVNSNRSQGKILDIHEIKTIRNSSLSPCLFHLFVVDCQ
jgi:hypothetical protein